ncbi:nucleotidyltransferase [Niallia nealsonii]|uniref:tRNA(Met) cytidine acetate ligase n=1 Tax=Niallia nealsonii TaxID=115979 RepID=A0A2N0YY23_9BACI|nr:nucleotidyltransferase [Niallia nealsonii]PKG22145.1 nucleotidyltransferase [Niallia nealsonii]
MKAVGVIVEYNPLHNGHLYHIQKAKELTNADIVIAVMSGPFLQRGEPAVVSKWHRADMALQHGIDLVIELPYAFATQHAEIFAYGAVRLLDSLRCDYICFGSESGDIQSFYNAYSLLEENKTNYEQWLKAFMTEGNSYPKAASLAFLQLTEKKTAMLDLSKPNNMLGFQYVKAVCSLKLAIQLVTIARKDANYHDTYFSSETIASATSIRKQLFDAKSGIETITSYIPTHTNAILQAFQMEYGVYMQWENYWPYLKFRLLQIKANELSGIYEVEEGLEHRLLASIQKADSFHHFLTLVKTKRYTWTRLQRICTHVLTNTKKTDIKEMSEPTYIRLLGSTASGRLYLKEKKKNFLLPVVSKLSSFQNQQIALDSKAAAIYSLGAPLSFQQKLTKLEYSQPPIMK